MDRTLFRLAFRVGIGHGLCRSRTKSTVCWCRDGKTEGAELKKKKKKKVSLKHPCLNACHSTYSVWRVRGEAGHWAWAGLAHEFKLGFSQPLSAYFSYNVMIAWAVPDCRVTLNVSTMIASLPHATSVSTPVYTITRLPQQHSPLWQDIPSDF